MLSTAGEGETSYGGGAGGKFRKRPFRRPQTTPYYRPPTSIRNPRSEGWLSKLVDPASKFISARAFKFFSNFRKHLTEAEQEPTDGHHQEAVPNNCNGAREPAIDQIGNLTNSSDGSGISELEQMLKQKTFTRSEIDRLTELLRSRTVELPGGDEEKTNEGNLFKPLSDLERHDGFTRSPLQENRNDRDKFHRIISTPGVSSGVLEEDISTPAELAKAYMGSRPSKVSPSMLGLLSQALKEDTPSVNHASFPSKSSALSLASKYANCVAVPENGFTTPRSRGRSAIYNMARTPYSRVHPTSMQKDTGSTNYGYGGPSSSSSQSAWVHDRQFGSRQLALKRMSSVLDDDSESVGAIRRIRQKPNLSYHRGPMPTHGTEVGYSASQHHLSSTQKPLLLYEATHEVSKDMEENGDDSIPSTRYSLVPSQSSKMATKILQHLEKMTPKEKSSESKLIAARDKSPIKLTPNMLRGQALRSLEDVDSTKLLQKQDGHKLEDSCNAWLQDARGSTSQKQKKVEENVPKDSGVPLELFTSSVNGDATVSMSTVPDVKHADSVISKFAAQPQKKRAFRMSAHEDSLELDDEIHSNGLVSSPSGEGKKEIQTSHNAVSTEAIILEKTPALPEVEIPVGSASNKRTDLEISDGSVVGKEKTGFYFSTSLAPGTTFQQDMPVQSSSAVDKVVPLRDPNPSSPLFGLSFKNVDKVPALTFSYTSVANEFPSLKSGSWPDHKQESSNSLANDAQLKILESDKSDDKDTQKAENIKGTSDSSPSAAASTSASGVFSFGAPAKNSNLNNGSLVSSPSIFSSAAPTLASSNFKNQIFKNSSTHEPSSTRASAMTSAGITTTTAALNSGPSMSAAPPSFPAAPIFSFASSLAPSTSPLATFSTATGAETTETNPKSEKETTFGNLSRSPFGGSSFALASTGSNTFGFNSSVASSTGNNQSQGSLPVSGSVSVVSSQASPATGAAMVTQSIPFQFGSSGSSSSPVFGTSGITSFTAASSLLGSSDPAAKPFGSGTTFALGSSTSSSDTNSISSSCAATWSIFSSSCQTSKPLVFGLAVSSPSPSAGFSFGASSTSIAATNSASMFGTSTSASSSSMFSFTSATATTPSLPSLFQSQPMFGNSTAFTAPGNNSDQMNMEDSMAEDPVQVSTPTVPLFSQPTVSPSPAGFMFGATTPSPSPFQFGGQQNPASPQNPPPFQASNSLDFSAGGSFSLGSGGGDKAARKMVRVSRSRNRKK